MNGTEPRGLVCLSATAARAYVDGLEAAIRLIDEYDRQWGTSANGYREHIRHEVGMFCANWELRNKIKLSLGGSNGAPSQEQGQAP